MENICEELREFKIKDLLAKKQIQQLRANSHELRQLERQLQSALVFKELKEQQKVIVQRKEKEFRRKYEENAKFSIECEQIAKSKLQQEEMERQKKDQLRETLQSQTRDMQLKRRIEFQDVKKDYERMENVFKQFRLQELEERKDVALRREMFRKEIEESIRNKRVRQELEKSQSIDDNKRSLTYQKRRDFENNQMLAERERIQKEKESLHERMRQQLATVNQEKEIRDNLLLSLLVEEKKEKDDMRYREALVKGISDRKKLRSDMESFRRDLEIQKENQFREQEDVFIKENLKYLEECDKIVQLSDEKRRRKKMEHNKTLKDMINIRRYDKAKEIVARIADFEKILNNEKESDELIQKERKRMLNAVPKELLSYLPAGALTSSDKEFLALTGQKMQLYCSDRS